MRKIEQAMCHALQRGDNFKRDNTRVVQGMTIDGVPYADVYLHHNKIASYFPTHRELYLQDAGWQSVTTKSRLNAMLTGFVSPRAGIFQRDWEWYQTDEMGTESPWSGSFLYRTTS